MWKTPGTTEHYKITADGVEPMTAWQAYRTRILLLGSAIAIAVAVLIFHLRIDSIYMGQLPVR